MNAVDICNLALSYLGQRGDITAIDGSDTTANAQTMTTYYPIARRTLLAEHPWSFATKRSGVLADTTSDTETWAYRYAVPSDMIEPIALLYDGARDDDKSEFVIEGDYIYSNAADVTLRYIYDQTDVTRWSMPFVEAVARKLAAMTAGTIVRGIDPRVPPVLEENARNAAYTAKQRDGRRAMFRPDERPSWIKARGALDERLPRVAE